MKPSYEALKRHHQSGQFYKSAYVADEAVYKELGYDLAELVKLKRLQEYLRRSHEHCLAQGGGAHPGTPQD